MNRSRVGTLAWTEQTRGILSGRDRVSLLTQAFMYGVARLPAEIRRALGIRRRRLARLEPEAFGPPDSASAREAEDLLAELASPMVANHSYRTYAWGAVLAAHEGIAYDPEVVYVASLLHDLYFADPHVDPEPHCFTLPAARSAMSLLAGQGWDAERCRLAAEAITLHLNLWPPRHSPEAFVVFVGARLDVIGYRYDEIDPNTADAVLERYPRLDLKRESARMFDRQADVNPGTRVNLYTRRLGVKWFMRRARFSE